MHSWQQLSMTILPMQQPGTTSATQASLPVLKLPTSSSAGTEVLNITMHDRMFQEPMRQSRTH